MLKINDHYHHLSQMCMYAVRLAFFPFYINSSKLNLSLSTVKNLIQNDITRNKFESKLLEHSVPVFNKITKWLGVKSKHKYFDLIQIQRWMFCALLCLNRPFQCLIQTICNVEIIFIMI